MAKRTAPAAAKSAKYRDLLTRTKEEVQQELLDITVEQAENDLAQGILSIKGQALKAEAEYKKSLSDVASAQRRLDEAKSSNPFSVQAILDARGNVESYQLSSESLKAEYERLLDAQKYLESLREELF